MVQPLFFDDESAQFEKTSVAEVALSEDPNSWPNELMQEVFKQCPYLADFEPQVTMDKVDAERGYGFGHVEVQNKTEIQHGAEPDAMESAGIKSVRIPIIIKDRKLQPLDLFITDDSQVMPLTEARLRQTIFRPQAFDITGRGPGDMSMIGQLYPPYRQNYGFGGGGATMNVGMGKEGQTKTASYHTLTDTPVVLCAPEDAWERFDKMEKKGSLLQAILPTVRPSDYTNFFSKVAGSKVLQSQFMSNYVAAGDSLKLLADYEPSDQRKLAQAALGTVMPTVVQVRKDDSGYTLKTASHHCWLPQESRIDRGTCVSLLGQKIVLAADLTGAATMQVGEGVSEEPQSPEEDTAELISQFGIYKVQDEQGRHLIGYVFTNLLDIDGTALPIALFTNGSQMAIQSDIVGINVGGGASLFEGPPQGIGAFYHLLPNGRAEATVPMTIKATLSAPEQGGVILHAETFDGREVQVIVQPNLEKITPSPEGDHLLIPDTFCWLPLDKAEETQLCGDPESFSKEGEAALKLASVQVRSDGTGGFSVSGFAVDKLANDQKNFLSLDDTMFLLSGLGADLDYVQKKLGFAQFRSAPVDVRVSHYIETAAERMQQAKVAAAHTLSQMPNLQVDLVKEAAVIPDPVAVDTVLSLGFLNPENLGLFIGYMPVIDGAQMKMCELLLAARLGLREVPTPMLEAAIRSVEGVLEGLKILAFQKA